MPVKIIDILRAKKPVFSFEFFPPKSDEDETALLRTARALAPYQPDFISVTWGAGGGTRRKTLELTSIIKKDLGVETMAHLTCVGTSRADVDAILKEIRGRGIDNILALRGDPPKGESRFIPHPDGFHHAAELVAHIRGRHRFCLGVASYPEGHPETPDLGKDLDNLKRKVDAGADFVTTQLFFVNSRYFDFIERARAAGIPVPILPGIMPVTNIGQLERFTSTCGATIPAVLSSRLAALKDDPEGVIQYGIDYAVRQCEGLLKGGAPGIHFYTLNRSRSTSEILKHLKKK
jgi:methylenetetrahydrofolate reductase (NADPH)